MKKVSTKNKTEKTVKKNIGHAFPTLFRGGASFLLGFPSCWMEMRGMREDFGGEGITIHTNRASTK